MKVDGLLINGQDAYETYGVIMGDDFLNQLNAPAGLKDFITFDSRVANGTEYLIKDTLSQPYARLKARDLTLKFRMFGADTGTLAERQASLQTRLTTLLSVLQVDKIELRVPDLNNDTYRLLYTGQSVTYALSNDRTSCLFGAKFVEPDPTDRRTFVNIASRFKSLLDKKWIGSGSLQYGEQDFCVCVTPFLPPTVELAKGDQIRVTLPPSLVMDTNYSPNGTSIWSNLSSHIKWYESGNCADSEYARDIFINPYRNNFETSTIGSQKKGNVITLQGVNGFNFVTTDAYSGTSLTIAQIEEWIDTNQIIIEKVEE